MSQAARTPLSEHLTPGMLVLLTVALAFSTFMEVLDTSIANVAVPTIAGNLGANDGTWVITSYGLAAAIVVPMTGWIARRFGEVRTFCISVLLFTFTSALCGLANSLPMLVCFRFMQGLVSGPMVPLSQTLLLANYPPQKRGMAMALWSMTVVALTFLIICVGGAPVDAVDHVLGFLLYYGVIDLHTEGGVQYIFDVNYDSKLLSLRAARQGEHARYVIDPAFWPALGIAAA
jgi:DHA2 family multidrug resistance protein